MTDATKLSHTSCTTTSPASARTPPGSARRSAPARDSEVKRAKEIAARLDQIDMRLDELAAFSPARSQRGRTDAPTSARQLKSHREEEESRDMTKRDPITAEAELLRFGAELD